jgi:hypothetical protein
MHSAEASVPSSIIYPKPVEDFNSDSYNKQVLTDLVPVPCDRPPAWTATANFQLLQVEHAFMPAPQDCL